MTGNDVTTLYLVRHGTTAWNEQLRYQGRADNPLDEAGERQGALLEGYFQDIKVDVGITSPLQRAVKTLDYCLASQKQPVPVLIDPGVIEFDFGEADGLTKEEICARFPVFYRMYVLNEDRAHAEAPGGETMPQLYARIRDAVLRIAREQAGKTVVIASHGTAIQQFLNFASGIPADKAGRFILCNVSVSCVKVDRAGEVQVEFIGDKHHIPKELEFSYGQPERGNA